MTIQAWLASEPVFTRQAEQGIFSSVTASTTVSQVGATQLSTDLVLLTTLGAAGAVKVLGGADQTGTAFGPCVIGDTMVVINHTGQNVTIYPQSGGTIKNGSANAGSLIATGLVAFLTYVGSGNWSMNAS